MDGGLWALQYRGGFEKNLCIWGFAVRGFRKLSSESFLLVENVHTYWEGKEQKWDGSGCHHPTDLMGQNVTNSISSGLLLSA